MGMHLRRTLFVMLIFSFLCFCNPAIKKVLPQTFDNLSGKRVETSTVKTYSRTPFSDAYKARLRAFFDYQNASSSSGPYSEAMKLAAGQPVDEDVIEKALESMNSRLDGSDFQLNGLLRILYQFDRSPLLSRTLKEQAKQAVLNYKYWPDEPGIDSMCTWTENHHIMFAAGGYLAGQLYQDEIFTNSGETGVQKMEKFRPRILRWLDLRFRTGFSEWLSHYYEEDIPPLLNLIDFCKDEEISERAKMVVDLLITDMALNQYRGVFGSTHGRAYEKNKKYGFREATSSIFRLLFGTNSFQEGNIAAVSFALSENYHMPRALYEIATDFDRPEMINRQRMGIRVSDAEQWGLEYDSLEDGMSFLSFEAYAHPKTICLTIQMLDEYRWWQNRFFAPFARCKRLIEWARRFRVLPLGAWLYEKDLTRHIREEVNIYTYRTPDYMLSSAQDYRKGYGGFQHHIWQATLDSEAVCFTTHPGATGGDDTSSFPNYWTGSGYLPRVAQHKNVAIVLYKVPRRSGIYLRHPLAFTHAWFPQDRFDEVVEENGWVFGRKNQGYIALWSREPYRWQMEDKEKRELIAYGRENVWVCEMGREETHGSFQAFIDAVSSANIRTRGLRISYESPAQGLLTFGWRRGFFHNGKRILLERYPRYHNPYMHVEFPGTRVRMEHNEHWLELSWDAVTRESSGPFRDAVQ